METTHPSLLVRVRDLDDHEAWREFDRRYRDLILRFCRRKGLQTSDAEDVRQMVMLNMARQLRRFEYRPAKGRFRDYLGRTVANAIHRYFRRPRLERDGLDTRVVGEAAAEPDTALDEEWESEWMLHHYRTAMETVRRGSDPRSVEVFEQLIGGGSVQDVAELFSMSRDAVHKVKQRMRDRLKRCIAEQVSEDETLV